MSTILKLCIASSDGHDHEVDTVLSTGMVNVNSTDDQGYTPLHWAMACNHPTIVTKLLARPETRLDITDSDAGWTGLHHACRNNSAACISVYGEDRRCNQYVLNMKDSDGYSPVMVAVKQGHFDCVKEMGKLAGDHFDTKNNRGETRWRSQKIVIIIRLSSFLR